MRHPKNPLARRTCDERSSTSTSFLLMQYCSRISSREYKGVSYWDDSLALARFLPVRPIRSPLPAAFDPTSTCFSFKNNEIKIKSFKKKKNLLSKTRFLFLKRIRLYWAVDDRRQYEIAISWSQAIESITMADGYMSVEYVGQDVEWMYGRRGLWLKRSNPGAHSERAPSSKDIDRSLIKHGQQ